MNVLDYKTSKSAFLTGTKVSILPNSVVFYR